MAISSLETRSSEFYGNQPPSSEQRGRLFSLIKDFFPDPRNRVGGLSFNTEGRDEYPRTGSLFFDKDFSRARVNHTDQPNGLPNYYVLHICLSELNERSVAITNYYLGHNPESDELYLYKLPSEDPDPDQFFTVMLDGDDVMKPKLQCDPVGGEEYDHLSTLLEYTVKW